MEFSIKILQCQNKLILFNLTLLLQVYNIFFYQLLLLLLLFKALANKKITIKFLISLMIKILNQQVHFEVAKKKDR